MKDVIDLFISARRAGTPLIAIQSSDQLDLLRRLFIAAGNGKTVKFIWDAVRGMVPVGDSAKDAARSNGWELDAETGGVVMTNNPTSAVVLAQKLPKGSILAMVNSHRFLDDPVLATGIYNLRDPFKSSKRTLLLTGTTFSLPSELTDVLLLDEPLPSDGDLAAKFIQIYENGHGEDAHCENNIASSCVDAARGLSAFAAEQVFAMSLTKDDPGVDVESCWERKRAAINQVKGLKFKRDGLTFDDIGGNLAFKAFMTQYVSGPRRPGCVLFWDEVEKAVAGSSGLGDSSGVAQDFHGTFLSWMEDSGHDGMISVGLPGTGKTFCGRAIGPTFGIPTVSLDVGALKGSLVGQSEQAVREALKVIDSIAGKDGAFVFATCNSESSLSPEFKRRFHCDRWYWGLPTKEERLAIWKIQLVQYGLMNVNTATKQRERASEAMAVDDENWTGAEIRNCVDLAWRLNCSFPEAARYVVPIAKSNPKVLSVLRQAADGNWLSASTPGPYRLVANEDMTQREISIAE